MDEGGDDKINNIPTPDTRPDDTSADDLFPYDATDLYPYDTTGMDSAAVAVVGSVLSSLLLVAVGTTMSITLF